MEYIALHLPAGAALSCGAARALVAYALRRRGRNCWSVISVDHFRGGGRGESLLLARPSVGIEVQFADYIFPVMRKYFTE